MHVRSIALKMFRNFLSLETEMSSGVNIICGHNAQGKTNLLESIYFCSSGRSTRAVNDRELIHFGCEEAFLKTEFYHGGSYRSISAHIIYNGKRTMKCLAVDKVPIKKTNELFGLLLTVAFSPDDLKLIKSSPSERRSYMDRELCQISPVYCHRLRQYYRALKQRNALLKQMQKGEKGESLDEWDKQLAQYGIKIISYRMAFIEQAGKHASTYHLHMTGGRESLEMLYRPNIKESDAYVNVLKKNRSRDIYLGSTSGGIHKDDIQFMINKQDARIYGSQGQQRTAALSAKLAEIEIINERTGSMPVLLLDDVLSELDEKRQAFLLSKIGSAQTILTCTGLEDILSKRDFDMGIKIMRMENGVLYDK